MGITIAVFSIFFVLSKEQCLTCFGVKGKLLFVLADSSSILLSRSHIILH